MPPRMEAGLISALKTGMVDILTPIPKRPFVLALNNSLIKFGTHLDP